MPLRETARHRILASILQTTFGKSSQAKYPTHFVSVTMPAEDTLLFKVQMIVNFGHQNVFLELRRKYLEESLEMVRARLPVIAEQYKAAVAAKDNLLEPKIEPYEKAPPKTISLKVNQATIAESIEYVGASLYNPQKTAFFRMQCIAEIT